MMVWLDETKNNWKVTDNFAARLFLHKNLTDIKHGLQVDLQFQKALKQIKDSVDVYKKVDEVVEKNIGMIMG